MTVEDNEGNSDDDTASAEVSVTDVLPTVDLTKTADPVTPAEPGGVFHFILSITNNSVENVTITVLTDSNALSPECQDLIGAVLTARQTVA